MRKLVLSEEVTRRAEKCGARLYAALAYNKRYCNAERESGGHCNMTGTKTTISESNHVPQQRAGKSKTATYCLLCDIQLGAVRTV
jgi:hypothetical protein